MRPILALVWLVIGFALEIWLLHVITHHPAGGWGDPDESFRTLLSYAVLPAIVALLPVLRGLREPSVISRKLATISSVAATGPISLVVALASYGHAMVLPMFLGFIVQLILATRCVLPVDAGKG